MRTALEEEVFPGAVLLVRLGKRVVYHHAFGLAARLPRPEPASTSTIYDLASLTKPLATATAMLTLVQDGRLSLDAPVQDVIGELRGAPVGPVTLDLLLCHRSGLPAWRPYYEQIGRRNGPRADSPDNDRPEGRVLDLIRGESLEARAGTRAIYSDLGYMVLGLVVSRVSGQSLADYCRERVYAAVSNPELFFIDRKGSLGSGVSLDEAHLHRIAPTENDPWRGRIVRGEVHDENAAAMGGIAGHSGLFGTAEAVAHVTGAWLDAYRQRESPLSPTWVHRFLSVGKGKEDRGWALGWDRPTPPSASGSRLSPESFGHLGFTGTSVWIDPTVELEVILLSNRVHPTRTNEAIKRFRPRIHDIVYDETVGSR